MDTRGVKQSASQSVNQVVNQNANQDQNQHINQSQLFDTIVIGAGQAGLSSSYFLTQRHINHLVLDANAAPGGAWQHRWDALTMLDVHGIADLPAASAPERTHTRANQAVPAFFSTYETHFHLPIIRPVTVDAVENFGIDGSLLQVKAATRTATTPTSGPTTRTWATRTIINATGTWTNPNRPHYPGHETFLGQHIHTVDFPGPEALTGKRIIVVGAGASAVQFIGLLAPIAHTVWVTRRPPQWRTSSFDELGNRLDALTKIEARAVAGLPPASVVSGTGLGLRAQEEEARKLGAYDHPKPMFDHIEPTGARWADGTFEPADVILWATGFRPAVTHLAPLHLESEHGGIALTHVSNNVQGATVAAKDPRVMLVGYGPSASTVGATRAARQAARAVERYLSSH